MLNILSTVDNKKINKYNSRTVNDFKDEDETVESTLLPKQTHAGDIQFLMDEYWLRFNESSGTKKTPGPARRHSIE